MSSRARTPPYPESTTRQRIVGAARVEFGERGYVGAYLERIGRRIDLPRATVNYHFFNKQELYRTVIERTQARLAEGIGGLGRSQGSSPTLLAELSTILTTVITIDTEDPSTVAFLITSVLESHRHPQLGTGAPGVIAATRAYLTTGVHDAVARGELRADTDIASLVMVLATVLCGASLYAGVLSDGKDPDAVADRTRRLLAGTLWQIHPDQHPSDQPSDGARNARPCSGRPTP